MQKILLFIILSVFSEILFAIEDDSFKNHDKYKFLELIAGKNQQTFLYDITFHPPKGKKLNSGSMMRLWEKVGKDWQVSDKAYTDGEMLFPPFVVKKELKAMKSESELALEIDFIHCNHSGGQCQMQKFLGKIKRQKNHNVEKFIFDLKV